MPEIKGAVRPFSEAALFEALSSSIFPIASVQGHSSAKYLVGYLTDIGAKSMVVETKYTDGEYLEDFVTYYAKCHTDYERRCKRLHFFSIDVTGDVLDGFVKRSLSAADDAKLSNSYLGFIVVRPLPGPVIGRSVLAHYDTSGGHRHYPCTRRYVANLWGRTLELKSLAFQEQDSVVAACATVALWSAFQKTAEMFSSPSPRPAQITRSATSNLKKSRPIPSDGLIVEQICSAVSDAGLEPEVVDVAGKEGLPLPSLLYGHLKMGLPVILGVHIEQRGLHALTLTGFDLEPTIQLKKEVGPGSECIPMVGRRIAKFYAHDDQIGPFARMRVCPTAQLGNVTFPVVFEGSWIDSKTGQVLRMFPVVAVIPVYNKIRVTFLDLQIWTLRLHTVLEALLPPARAKEWDIYMTTTNEFKASLGPLLATQLGVAFELLTTQLPRFLWRAAFSVDGVPAFELLADATDIPNALPMQWVIWHDPKIKTFFANFFTASPKSLLDQARNVLTHRFYDFLEQASKQ